MVEQGWAEESSVKIGRLLSMASSSSNANKIISPIKQASHLQYKQYPPPLAKYEDVVASPSLFMDTLGKLHATMGTKFMIPIIGGRDLDLHRVFVEVTSRGGIEKVLRERKWKEVTAVFNFPSSATNSSFILRKYYYSLLHHYEKIYYFESKMWSPLPSDASHNASVAQTLAHGLDELHSRPSSEIEAAQVKLENINKSETSPQALPAPPAGSTVTVTGMIDGKFEGGYLVTVTMGSETLKGVLYQSPVDPAYQIPQHPMVTRYQANVSGNTMAAAPPPPRTQRRRRRKKCEMKKRDPAHPKPNRSGYNFFFAEQHARLKPLHPGRDRDISRMIGELWNNLKENDRSVYQEKAVKDKERYRLEMEEYRERQRTGQIVSNAMPIQQQPAVVNVMETEDKIKAGAGDCTNSPENDVSSGKSHRSNPGNDKGSDTEAGQMVELEGEDAGPSTLGNAIKVIDECPLKKQKVGDEGESACVESKEKIGEGEFVDEKVKE